MTEHTSECTKARTAAMKAATGKIGASLGKLSAAYVAMAECQACREMVTQ